MKRTAVLDSTVPLQSASTRVSSERQQATVVFITVSCSRFVLDEGALMRSCKERNN